MQVFANFPTEDTMPLNDADRAWIREAIRSAHTREGLGKLTGFIKDWGGTGAAIAILIFVLAKWEGYVEFRTSTNIRLDRIEKGIGTIENRLGAVEQTLVGIQYDLSRQSLINHASLPLQDFKANLPDLSSAIAAAQQQHVRVSSKVTEDLGKKLAASTDAPHFWPTAAEFISYRSQVATADFQNLIRPDLPNCTDHAPTPMKLIVSDEEAKYGKAGDVANVPDLLNETDKNKTHLVPAVYKDCRFTLDSPEETSRIPNLGEHRSYILTFRHCQIVYRGGPITLLTPNPEPTAITGKSRERSDVYIITGQTVHFENCLFLFAINSTPPVEGQSLTVQLLAQRGQRFTVRFPESATQS